MKDSFQKNIDKLLDEMRMHQQFDEKSQIEDRIDKANLYMILFSIKELWSEIDREGRAVIRQILRTTALRQLENVRTTQEWLDNKSAE